MATTILSSLIASLAVNRSITGQDVVALRGAVFGGDVAVSPDEAEALIDLDDATVAHAPEWHAFYKEALTDFLVRQQQPAGYVDEAGAAWLIQALQRDGRVRGDSELELLVHILDQADEVPHGLIDFTLRQIAAKVLEDGRVAAAEVALMRRALYAPAGDGNLAITRTEAELLFDINDACRGADNDPAWTDLFSKALVASVMTVSGYRTVSREDAGRRQLWLETPETFGGFFGRMGQGLDQVWRNPMSAMRDDAEDGFIAENAADETAYRTAEPIDAGEAQWLVDRIKRNGLFDEGEQRAVDFLRREAPVIHPSFKPVIDEAAPSPGAARVFGRRGVT